VVKHGGRIFVNTPAHLQKMAIAIRDAGVPPELEVFDTSHLLLAKKFLEQGYVKPPGLFQICLGISWSQPAMPEAMLYMRNLRPPDCVWFAFGISLHQFPMVAQTLLLGGHPRVGLEDNIYLEKGKLAPSNAALVEKAVRIVEILGRQVATAAEARQLLGLAPQAERQTRSVARVERSETRERRGIGLSASRMSLHSIRLHGYAAVPASAMRSPIYRSKVA